MGFESLWARAQLRLLILLVSPLIISGSKTRSSRTHIHRMGTTGSQRRELGFPLSEFAPTVSMYMSPINRICCISIGTRRPRARIDLRRPALVRDNTISLRVAPRTTARRTVTTTPHSWAVRTRKAYRSRHLPAVAADDGRATFVRTAKRFLRQTGSADGRTTVAVPYRQSAVCYT